jgi:hypothetical protein
MIKFTAIKNRVSSPLADSENFIHNKMNEALCNRMTELIGERSCPIHPEFENEISVNLADGEKFMNLVSYCCDHFKQSLDLVVANKVPPDWQ